MKIEVISPKGYCSGVTLAIQTALKAKADNPGRNVYVLGMLVHNEETISFLKEKGIITLTNKDNDHFKLIEDVKDGDVLIFTAHGHDERLDRIAKEKNIIVYDATCPMVKSNIDLIKRKINEGYEILFIGVNNHPETKAMLSISNNVNLYNHDSLNNYLKSTNSPIFVTNQTTLNYDELDEIHKEILSSRPDAVIQNEVCNTTRLRQSRLKNLDKDVDLIYVVGSLKSNNTMKLYEIAKATYSTSTIRLIKDKNDISLEDLANKNHIVIVAGASTPPATVDAIHDLILSIR